MDKQTPTQIAGECIKEQNMCNTFQIRAVILAHKQDWENELEFLKSFGFSDFGHTSTMDKWEYRKKELTSALKILEAEK